MTRFWKRLTGQNEIEARLRRERPAPPRELVDELVARIEADSARALRPTRPRIALVGVVGAVTLVAFGASGGIGYAQSAVSGAASSTADAVVAIVTTQPKKKPTGGQNAVNGSNPSQQQYQEKVLVCHNGHTISISSSAVPAHLRHGDTLGACT